MLIQYSFKIMVTISSVEKRKAVDGKEFNVMNLQGSVEVVISKESGKPYLTARKTSIPCTFDEVMAKSLVGQKLPGEIERIEVDEYEFIVPGTKKKLKLTHSYRYSADPASIEEVVG
ncbi:MAG: hypothetical protein ACTSQA_03835 [Candidatus Heimdallarchaeaceae archaeon]